MSEPEDLLGAIAVIGFSGRFPAARDVDQLWRNLQDGKESLHTFTDDELKALGVPSDVYSQPNYVRAAMVLEDADLFDAEFFAFSPREAEIRDPQHRLFLECAWEALEGAGYNPQGFDGQIGVFGGCSPSYYGRAIPFDADPALVAEAYQREIGSQKDYLCTTVSYKIGLRGPAMTIQTACSTSLVAVCLACQSLMSYQCDMALAGGASVNTRQRGGYFYQEGMVLSPDGHCRAFDKEARGTVLGQGVGVVLLKRLTEAIHDGDTIHAVIRGFAVNNDGSDKVGYTAPSVHGQAEVITMAQALSGVPVDTISYIEAHGTGTPLGDPIEISALTKAFRQSTDKQGFCCIGSLKTNVGHLDAAAGVAGLIKTILMLKHRQIPATLHFQEPNPEIEFVGSPFFVSCKLSTWDGGGLPLRAGVSSFGIGGTNAHVVLEEAPNAPESGPTRPFQLLRMSAKTPTALEAVAANLGTHLASHPTANLADVAYTLSVGRRAFPHRRFAVCRNAADAAQNLGRGGMQGVQSRQVGSTDPSVVFLFPGQGSQYVNMGRNLYEHEPLFRRLVDRCAEILETELDLDLRRLLYPEASNLESATERLRKTCYQQPALFTVEYALARLWQEWGIHPAALIGHSIGEYAAACLSGVFSLEDALRLVAARGRMMEQLPPGSMLSVRLPVENIRPKLNGRISLAAINAPALCVVSGPSADIRSLQEELERDKVVCRGLHTSHAFHSSVMDAIVASFADEVSRHRRESPEIPIVSTATGTWLTAGEATDSMYWARQLRNTVRFADSIDTVLEHSESVLLEVGPRQACTTFARQLITDKNRQQVVASLGDTADDNAEWQSILTAMGQLWLSGAPLRGELFYQHERRQRVPLPTYPFERKRFWEQPMQRRIPAEGSPNTTTSTIDEKADTPHEQAGATHPAAHNAEPYEPSWTDSEVLLADIWREVLGTSQVALGDNYFSDLGGDSLSILRVIEMIASETGLRLDPNIFLVNTLRQIAAHISQRRSLAAPGLRAASAACESTASLSQKGKAGTQPLYFGEMPDRLFGIYHPPQGPGHKRVGVLLCYPLGQEYMVSHWAFRRLSQLLSQAGFPVFRFDYFGTGDSAGKSGDGTAAHWTADVRTAYEQLLRLSDVDRVSIVGLRLGATLAAAACADGLPVENLVLWNPVVNGRVYLDELERYAVLHNHPSRGKTDELVGFRFPAAMRTSIEELDLLGLTRISARQVFVVTSRRNQDSLNLHNRLTSVGVPCDYQVCCSRGSAAGASSDWEGEADILEDGLLPIEIGVLSTLVTLVGGGAR